MQNAKRLQEAADAYFQACDDTRQETVLKNGELRYYQVPYTMAGLCAALGMSREMFLTESKKQTAAGTLLRGYAAKIEQHTVERALLGELNNAVAALLLKSWGYGEAAASDEDVPAGLTVTLEDKEDWSQ